MKRLISLIVICAALASAGCKATDAQASVGIAEQTQQAIADSRALAVAQGDTETVKKLDEAKSFADRARAVLVSIRDPITGEITLDSMIAGGTATFAPLAGPLAPLVILGGGLLGLVIQEIRVRRRKGEADGLLEAARAMLAGIKLSPPEAKAAVEAEVAKQADPADIQVMAKIMADDKLPGTTPGMFPPTPVPA